MRAQEINACIQHRQPGGFWPHGPMSDAWHIPWLDVGRLLLNYAQQFMRMEIVMTTAQAQTSKGSLNTRQSPKRATNLSLSADVLEAAKSLKINISQLCDTYLRQVVRQEQERRWREDHADFIAAYNATVESEGLPLDEWRTF